MTRRHRYLASALVTLGVANVARTALIPARWDFAFNLAIGAAVLGIGLAAGSDARALGADRRDLGAGLRLGALAFAAIGVVVVAGGLLGLVTDDQADVGVAAMLRRVLVVIPLGTVLVEEVAFRGVLHGLLGAVTDRGRTIAAGALLFGLWHVYPAWHDGSVDAQGLGRVGAVLGVFVATTVAGVGFVWLRTRSASLAAPMLAHLATNGVTFAVAWAAT